MVDEGEEGYRREVQALSEDLSAKLWLQGSYSTINSEKSPEQSSTVSVNELRKGKVKLSSIIKECN